MSSVSNIAPFLNIRLTRGDTFALTIRLRQESTNELQDLTDVTPLMQVRSERTSPEVLHTFTTTVNTTDKTITISLSDWSSINFEAGVFDLQLTYPNGVVETVLRGTLYIDWDVSR